MKTKHERSGWTDPDDAPRMTDEDFRKATWRVGDKVVTRAQGRKVVAKRGRPPGTGIKESTTIRLDKDVLEAFRAGGPGWQTRMNAALREWLDKHA